jgi:hypothetical protein
MGPDARLHYWETLGTLSANPAEATDLLEAAYQGLPEARYLDRWKLVDTLAALEDAVALDALVRIAAEEIPEERYPDGAEFSSHSEETMIRAAAIDGLRRLAQDGVSGAEQALIDVVADAHAGARLAAVVAYRSLGAGAAGELSALEAALSPTDQWMLEVEVAGAPPASAYTRPIDAEDPSRPHEAGDADDPDEWDDLPPLGDPEVHPAPSGAMDAMPQSAHAKHRRAQ